MSKSPQLVLTKRGRAFFDILEQGLHKAEGSDSTRAREALNDLGFDDQCINTIKRAYKERGPKEILAWLQSGNVTSEAFFLVLNSVRRTSMRPLTGLLATVFQETIVFYPSSAEVADESVSEIHVPCFEAGSLERAYLDSLGEHEKAEHVRDILIGRFQTFITRKLEEEACPRGEKRAFIVDCQRVISQDSNHDLFLKEQIDRALHDVVSELDPFQVPKIKGVYLFTDVSIIKPSSKDSLYHAVSEANEKAAVLGSVLKDFKPTKVLLSSTLAGPDGLNDFTPVLEPNQPQEVIAERRFSELPKTPDAYFATQYLRALEAIQEQQAEESDESDPVELGGHRSPCASDASMDFKKPQALRAAFVKRRKKDVLLSLTFVPIALGLLVGIGLGASGVWSASAVPALFASIGPIGFSMCAGILGGVGLAVVLLMIAGPVLAYKDRHLHQGSGSRVVTHGSASGMSQRFLESRSAPNATRGRGGSSELVDI